MENLNPAKVASDYIESNIESTQHIVEENIDLMVQDLSKYWLISSTVGAVIGSIGAMYLHNYIKRHNEEKKLKEKEQLEAHKKVFTSYKGEPKLVEDLMKEQLVRNYQFFGENSQNKIRKSYMVVIGLGSIGSSVASSLIRSGVARIKLIDYANITLSCLSSHAFADRKDIGLPKVRTVKKYQLMINENIEVKTHYEFLETGNIHTYIDSQADYVIDCTNHVKSKIEILKYCIDKNLKVITCGSKFMKADPTKLQIRDISESIYDPLLKHVRLGQKKTGVQNGATVVYSTENENLDPKKKDPRLSMTQTNHSLNAEAMVNAIGPLFGHAMVSWILCDCAGQNYNPKKIDEVKQNHYEKIQVRLRNYLYQLRLRDMIDYDIDDIYFVVRDMAKWKSVISDAKGALMELFVFDLSKKVNGKNLVQMTRDECKNFEKLRGDGQQDRYFEQNPMDLARMVAFVSKCEEFYEKNEN